MPPSTSTLQYHTVLLTGGAGFIGSHLADSLLKEGRTVVCLDNFDPFYDRKIKERNLEGALKHPKFHLVEGDIRDRALIHSLFEKWRFEVVLHLAAKAGVRPSLSDPFGYYDVNVNGTLTLLEACRKWPPRHFVFASSSSVYGNEAPVPFREDDPCDRPISPYAGSKRAAELACYTFHHLCKIPVTSLRFFTVYGPRQRPEMAIHHFARRIIEGKPIELYGEGSSSRDYTYVEDIVKGVLSAVEKPHAYRIFNLGNSEPVSLEELVSALERAIGKPAKKKFHPRQPGDVQHTSADIALAREHLGYSPQVSLPSGIERFVAWLLLNAKNNP